MLTCYFLRPSVSAACAAAPPPLNMVCGRLGFAKQAAIFLVALVVSWLRLSSLQASQVEERKALEAGRRTPLHEAGPGASGWGSNNNPVLGGQPRSLAGGGMVTAASPASWIALLQAVRSATALRVIDGMELDDETVAAEARSSLPAGGASAARKVLRVAVLLSSSGGGTADTTGVPALAGELRLVCTAPAAANLQTPIGSFAEGGSAGLPGSGSGGAWRQGGQPRPPPRGRRGGAAAAGRPTGGNIFSGLLSVVEAFADVATRSLGVGSRAGGRYKAPPPGVHGGHAGGTGGWGRPGGHAWQSHPASGGSLCPPEALLVEAVLPAGSSGSLVQGVLGEPGAAPVAATTAAAPSDNVSVIVGADAGVAAAGNADVPPAAGEPAVAPVEAETAATSPRPLHDLAAALQQYEAAVKGSPQALRIVRVV